jgi:hypothetical protein
MEQERMKENLHERLKKRDSDAADEQERHTLSAGVPSKTAPSTKEKTSQQVPTTWSRMSKLTLAKESKNAD